MAVDWDFIAGPDIEGESTHKTGYVPKLGSGFTVGSLDVGQHSDEDIRTMLQSYANKLDPDNPQGYGNIRSDLRKKLTPYVKEGKVGSVWGKYGSQEGYDVLAKTEKFIKEDIEYIMAAKRYQVERKLEGKKGWDKLDSRNQTVLASNAWQWGTNKQDDGRNRFEELWAVRDDKVKLEKKLKELAREGYTHRRETEAAYVNPPLSAVQEVLDENNKIGQTR